MNAVATEHTLTLPWVEAATSHFVNANDMREAASLALASGLNLIFSGPGGHAKSDFLTAVFGAIETDLYVKSFGQGTSTEELYGGLDLDALNRQGTGEKSVLQYTPELSFLAYNVAVFEELFDAPSRVLTSLKDTMTAKELRNGHQRFQMATKVIAGATNHSPQDIAEGGPEIAALVERFPIQLEVKWSDYSESSFVELFAAVTGTAPGHDKITWNDVADLQERVSNVKITPLLQRMLARTIVELRKDNVVISPRTAVLAMQLTRAAAAINGRDTVVSQDVAAIAFLPGAHQYKSRIAELIEEFVRTMAGEEELALLEQDLTEVYSNFADTASEDELRSFLRTISELEAKARALPLSTDQATRRNEILRGLDPWYVKANKALSDIRLAKSVEVHRRELNGMFSKIKKYRGNLKYAQSQAGRDHAIMNLEILENDVIDMQLHTSLDDLRLDVLATIRNAKMN